MDYKKYPLRGIFFTIYLNIKIYHIIIYTYRNKHTHA